MSKVFYLFLAVILFASCKKEEKENIVLTFKTNLQNNSIEIDGRKINLSQLKIYISNIKLIDKDNEIINIKDVLLYELNKNNQIIYKNTTKKTIKTIQFSIGLDSLQNSELPATFPEQHAMSIEKDMHWGMIKYRFFVAEGVLDSSINKNKEPNFPFSLHLGRDELLRTKTFNISKPKSEGNIDIIFNYDKMFESEAAILNPRNYFSIHSSLSEMDNANLLITNFVNGITINY